MTTPKSKPNFYTRFNRPKAKGLSFDPEKGRTQSEFAKDCDINLIMAKYKKTGQLPQVIQHAEVFGDFTQIPDFHEMQNRVAAAHEMFDALPSKVRKHFNNNPGAFIDAAATEDGRASLVALGLGKELVDDLQSTKAPYSGTAGASPSPGGQPAEPVKTADVAANEPQQPSKKGK